MAGTIGIGGHLTMPPLPHHRAYGSVPRRFGGLSARQRLHGKQSKTFEALVGEGPMQCARRTQSPWSLRTEDGCTGHLLRDIQVTKFFVTRVMSFSRDKGSDGLWWQGIDLIGDKCRRQVGEGIENGAMLGQPEGGEFLDMT